MRMKGLRSLVVMSVFLLITAYTATTTIIYGDIDAGGANDGSNLDDTYNYLQDGLASAESGDEIRVTPAICRYEVIDLGTLPGGGSSYATSINDSGQIVGSSETSLYNYRATLFDESGGGNNIDLGTLGGTSSHARSINNNGQIVGISQNDGFQRATLFDPTGSGSNIDLGIMGRENSSAYSINNSGQIVGWGNNSSGNACAVLFDPSGAGNNIDLGTLGGSYASARAINNHGQIVGWSSLISGRGRATLFDISGNGININLGLLTGSVYSEAESINDSGQIVGHSGDLSEHYFAILFDNSGSGNNIYLGSLGGSSSRAQSINNSGQIVGWAENSLGQRRACLFDPNGGGNNIDLNTLIAADSGWILEQAISINNHGWIVGGGTNPDGFGRAYLLKIAQPKTYYVDADATGANDGGSWADAFKGLQAALAAAWNGDEIRVAQGVYKPAVYMPPPPPPSSPLDSGSDQPAQAAFGREASFQLKNGVIIKGGFAGCGEPDPNARDIKVYETVLSGDLFGNDEPNFINYEDNSYHVITGSNCDQTAVLDGFTITAGNANGSYQHRHGGGMYSDNGSPTLIKCKFIRNSADWKGGGVYNNWSSPRLMSCTFGRNSAWAGAGMVNQNSNPVVYNCNFTCNSAQAGAAGMWNYSSNPTLNSCTFVGNSAGNVGGGMTNDYCVNPKLTDCTFSRNSAGLDGGGIYNYRSDPRLTNCMFTGNLGREGGGVCNYRSSPTLTNCTFNGNSANEGGGINNRHDCSPTLTNCTFAGNFALNGSALAFSSYLQMYPSNAQLTNCILWNSSDEIWNNDDSTITIMYSDVQGGWPGQGNINVEPCFVDAGYWDANGVWIDGDYHLLQTSACINAGDNNSLPADTQDLDGDGNTTEPIPFDIEGNPRIVYDVVDMGAYEFLNKLPNADAGPDQIIECACNTVAGTKVTLDGTNSSDPDRGVLTYTWIGPFLESPIQGDAPMVTLEDGCPDDYVITLVVNDGIDDSEPNEVVITVVDMTTPDFELSVSPTILWPPDHKMYEVTPSWTVSDKCDQTPDVSLVSIEANEGDDIIGDGHTSNDIQIGEDGSIHLRSERSGTSGDRIYTITYQAVDDSGNAAVRSATVSIPHDFRMLARIADRWLWAGPAGRTPEDLNGDGVVNLADFARFAENWIK